MTIDKKAEELASKIDDVMESGYLSVDDWPLVVALIASLSSSPAPEDVSTKTCKSECGLRQRYPISCKRHDCKHLRKTPAPEAPK